MNYTFDLKQEKKKLKPQFFWDMLRPPFKLSREFSSVKIAKNKRSQNSKTGRYIWKSLFFFYFWPIKYQDSFVSNRHSGMKGTEISCWMWPTTLRSSPLYPKLQVELLGCFCNFIVSQP